MSERPPLRRALAVLVPCLIVALLAPAADAQQDERWTIGDGPHARDVTASSTRGYAAIPVTSLVALGVEVISSGRDVRVRVGGREAVFTPESPFFRAGETVHQLVHPVYLDGGVMYLPVQFLLEQLPLIAGPVLEVDLERRLVARAPDAGRSPPRAEREERREPAPESRPEAAQPPLVVIDPGHGGRDPGAIGPGGTREKDVVLEVGGRLAELLRERGGFEVRMTRDRDTLIALADRRRKANSWRGDGGRPALFVSIHANASDNRSARGFETYFLSEARSEHARRVAERENAAQRFEEPSENGSDDPLRFIHNDLLVNHYLHESSAWAGIVQRNIAPIHPGPDRGVRQAGFVVLNGTLMPSVLVELGFITNASEERLLIDASFQRRMAERLAESVQEYFEADANRSSR